MQIPSETGATREIPSGDRCDNWRILAVAGCAARCPGRRAAYHVTKL